MNDMRVIVSFCELFFTSTSLSLREPRDGRTTLHVECLRGPSYCSNSCFNAANLQ